MSQGLASFVGRNAVSERNTLNFNIWTQRWLLMSQTTNPFFTSEHVFLCYWMNKQHGLSREGFLLYVQSHISLRSSVVSTLTDLFILDSVKAEKKENQEWRWSWEGRGRDLVWDTHLRSQSYRKKYKLLSCLWFILYFSGWNGSFVLSCFPSTQLSFIPFSLCYAFLTSLVQINL